MKDTFRCFIELKILRYADDTTHYVSVLDIGQCISIRNQGLSHLYRWLYMNKSSFNVTKTNYVIFNRRKQINLNASGSITLKNAALEREETVKFLGVYLDEGQPGSSI